MTVFCQRPVVLSAYKHVNTWSTILLVSCAMMFGAAGRKASSNGRDSEKALSILHVRNQLLWHAYHR